MLKRPDTCKTVRPLLDDYVDGVLSPDRSRRIVLHLQSCRECAAAVEGLQTLLAGAADLPGEIAPPRDTWAGIATRLDADPRREARRGSATETVATGESIGPVTRRGLWLVAALLAFALLLPAVSELREPPGAAFALGHESRLVIRDCREAVDTRDPLTTDGDDSLDESLTRLETALHETERAMAQFGEGTAQFKRLAAGYRHKMDILQRIAIRSATR